MSKPQLIPLSTYQELPPEQMIEKSQELVAEFSRRRTVRDFSDREVPEEVIENCLRVAGLAPNGANLQPWQFVVIRNAEVKKQIRDAAEREEKEFYSGRAPQAWLDALEHLGTDDHKPYLEKAPFLIAVFSKNTEINAKGEKTKNYYAIESTGLATGFLISALHRCGLVSLTHTPSPMNFLNVILDRPSHEKPFVLLVCGYPSEDAKVPNITKKALHEFSSFID